MSLKRKTPQIRGNKYNAKRAKSHITGKSYDSQLEKYVAEELEWLRQEGKIESIQEQATIRFYVNGHPITQNRVDFKVICSDGEVWYVEAKGQETDRYRIIKDLIIALLDEIEPGARYFLVKGRVGKTNWKELTLVRKPKNND